jgi:hypothetical protein
MLKKGEFDVFARKAAIKGRCEARRPEQPAGIFTNG